VIFNIFCLILYTVFFVFIPVSLLLKFFRLQRGVALVVAPWLAIVSHVFFFELTLFLGIRQIGIWLYPVVFLFYFIFVQLSSRVKFKNLTKNVLSNFSMPLALFVVYGILLTYWLVQRRQILPLAGQPAVIWLDLSYFSSLVASLKEHVIAHDYHIAGALARYHFFCFQWGATLSSIFNVSALSTVTFLVPTFLISYVSFSLYFLLKTLGFGRWWAGIFGACCLYTASLGGFASFPAGLDTAFNLFSSPTVLMSLGFCISMLAIVCHRQSDDGLRLNILLGILAFATVGTKISSGFVFLVGFGIASLAEVKLRCWRKKFATLVSMGLGAVVSYLFYFYEKDPLVVDNLNFQFPGPLFYNLNPFPEHLPTSILASFFGLFFRYLPWWVLVFMTWPRKEDVNRTFFHVTLYCGLVGITMGLLLNIRGNELHFYHIGFFLLLILAASFIVKRIRVSSVAQRMVLISLVTLNVFPLWGTGGLAVFGGYETDGVTPMIRPTELDENSFAAYSYIREKSASSDLVLTSQDRVESPSLGKNSYNFYASAITERQVYLEGWGFSKFHARNSDQQDIISKLSLLRDNFYSTQEQSYGESYLQQINPQWIVWDKRINGEIPGWLQKCLLEKKDFGPVAVFYTGNRALGKGLEICKQ